MAIVELQFREQAFGELLKREVNRRRPTSPTLTAGEPDIVGRLLDKITAVACGLTSQSTGELTANIDLSILTYDSLAIAKAAGSLVQPPTREGRQRIQITLKVMINPTPQGPKPTLTYSSPFFPGGSIDLGDLADVGAVQGAIVLLDSVPPGQGVVVIRLGTDINDSMDDPVVDRIVAQADWTLITPGSLIAGPFVKGLAEAVADAVKPNPAKPDDVYEPGSAAAGAYLTVQLPLKPAPPIVLAWAEIIAVDACPVFNIDVAVKLQVLATFAAKGPNLEITLELTWDADSTWCQIADFFVLTPISPFIIEHVAAQQASEAILGKAKPFQGFKEIARDDKSVTFLQKRFLDVPSQLTITSSQFTDQGLLVGGALPPLQHGGGLQGWSSPPISDIHINCSPRRVTVQFNPAQVGLWDFDPPGGPPKLFPQSTVFSPPNAWVVAPAQSNSSLELLLNFIDPPGGRLPAGTATSVFLMTDCGLRWVDLGKIPVDHPQPTTADMQAMISKCMAKSAGWKERVLSVLWLPRPPAEARGIPSIRQWMIGLEDMERSTTLQFVAVTAEGRERSIGVIEGRSRLAVQVTTDADETLEIRSSHDQNRLPAVTAQRWITPFASMRLKERPIAIAAAAGLLALRTGDGGTSLIDVNAEGRLHHQSFDAAGPAAQGVDLLNAALDREQRRGREAWNSAAQLDSSTVAVVHNGSLLIGRAGELQTL